MYFKSWWRSVLEAELEKKKTEGKKTDWWTGTSKQQEAIIATSVDSKKFPNSNLNLSATWGSGLDQ